MKVTIKDIAKRAGVSHPTVSRALNNSPLISDEVKSRIVKISKEMGYKPNILAKGLNTRKSFTIGVIMNYLDNPFSSEIFQGAEEVALESNYLFFFGDSRNDAHREYRYIQGFIERSVDGILIYPSAKNLSADSIRLLNESEIPVVFVNHSPEVYDFNTVTCNDILGGKLQATAILSAGYQRVAYLTNASEEKNNERTQSFLDHLNKKAEVEIIRIQGTNHALEGYKAVMEIINKKSIPEIIATYTDELIPGVFSALKENNLQIPEDIGLIGYGNIKSCHPPEIQVSTVDYPKYETGKQAMLLLLKMITNNNYKSNERIYLDPEYLEGNTLK